MKLSDLEYAPPFDLLAPAALFRVQRSRSRTGTVRIGKLLLPPSSLLNGRFDVLGVPVPGGHPKCPTYGHSNCSTWPG